MSSEENKDGLERIFKEMEEESSSGLGFMDKTLKTIDRIDKVSEMLKKNRLNISGMVLSYVTEDNTGKAEHYHVYAGGLHNAIGLNIDQNRWLLKDLGKY